MTREEYIKFANALKNNYTIDFDKLPEFCDMAISALSNNGNSISRQAVLNTLDNMDKALDEDRTVEKYKELLTECIKVLPSAENDGDLISRQAVLDELEKWDWQDLYLPIHFKQILDDVPSVENKGEWIDEGFYAEGHSEHAYRCSECGEHYIGYVGEFKFCPNCGARMKGGE